MKYINDQLDPTQTKADALKLVDEGVNVGWVTCDVDYATPRSRSSSRRSC